MKVLIVEDDGILALNTMKHLVGMGHAVTGMAKSADTALKKIEADMPELVLMDIKLYGPLSGIEITRIINDKYGIPVIYITAHSDEETLAGIGSTKHFGVIPKPFEPYQLREALERLPR